MHFAKLLTRWYLQHKRDLPWRDTDNPYIIWLSEIMLQQTRVAQGLPFFLAFVEAFPTIFDLASADEQKVLRLWQGLGYYSRARNLHKTAQFVVSEFGGKFPRNYHGLLQLKGVGEYTAAAIASFSYGEAVPVVDGNVFRVLSRYFDVETDIANASAKKEFAALARELMPKDNPALFNQSIMEFGALQCVPKNPNCAICPLNAGCLALQKGKVGLLPVKSKKAKAKNRFFNYFVISDDDGNTVIQQRTGKGIWENLYEFPLLETDAETSLDAIAPNFDFVNEVTDIYALNEKSTVHKLSHQHLHIKFWKVSVKGRVENGLSYGELAQFPFPIVLFNFIESDWK